MRRRPIKVSQPILGLGLLVAALAGVLGCTSSSTHPAPSSSPPVAEPTPDRHGTDVSPPPPPPVALTRYAHDVEGDGALWVTFHTSLGPVSCELFERRVPRLVDNFVGLARGLKPWRDPHTGERRRAPFYDGMTWTHRAHGWWIQSGDPTGDGLGGPGYVFEHDQDLGLRFDQPGRLAMLQRHTHGVGSQFIITLRALPRLDGRYPIFGQCRDMTRLRSLAQEVVVERDVPKIEHVQIERRD